MSSLEHQSIDELNNGLCPVCRTSIAVALNLNTVHTILCNNCDDIISEMLKRMHAIEVTNTRH
jgi:hypothetical protein